MSDPELDPEQEEQVRRLLADARLAEPMPADVAQRLDRVLEQLTPDEDSAPVVDLAARRHRRRRTAGQLLVAAAAVTVVGYGVTHLPSSGSGGGSAADSSVASDQKRPEQPSSAAAGDGGGATTPDGQASSRASTGAGSASVDGIFAGLPATISSDSFGHDVRGAVKVATMSVPAPTASPLAGAEAEAVQPSPAGWSCAPGDYGPGRLVPVVYDGTPAVLVVAPEQGTELQVKVLACGSAAVLRSATVPVHRDARGR